jgi:hypothetical protein
MINSTSLNEVHYYLGGFIDSTTQRDKWLDSKVGLWMEGIR